MGDFNIPEEVPVPLDLYPCDICGRKFVETTLQRHVKICEKSASKKRKVFDITKQRLEGMDIKSVSKPDEKKIERAKQATANWRQKHEYLVNTLRSARNVSHAIRTGGPLPAPPAHTRAVNPDYIQCPHCQRNFNETVSERHIPWCKEKSKRISPNKNASTKDRVAVRTNYKPPLPGNKKRQIVPPKASLTTGRTMSETSTVRRGPAMRTGRTLSDLNARNRTDSETTLLDNQYRNMHINERSPDKGRGRYTLAENRDLLNGIKARSASLDRRISKQTSSYRSSSGDALVGKGRQVHASDDDDDYESNGSYGNSADRYGRRLTSPNHALSQQRVKAVQDPSDTPTYTPSPPPKNTSAGTWRKRPSLDSIKTSHPRMSKFCHECGTQYPVTHAKFCCECGTKRPIFE